MKRKIIAAILMALAITGITASTAAAGESSNGRDTTHNSSPDMLYN